MPAKTMSWWAFLWAVLFFITLRRTLGHDDVLDQGLYVDPVAADHQNNEPHMNQWSAAPMSSPACPQQCICKKNVTHHIISVKCPSGGLNTVPDLPETTVDLSLRNNFISRIDCTSFEFLRSLESVDLMSNNISDLPPCVFQSQSNSLLTLSISKNKITYLDVNLFQGLFHLELLDVSMNFITTLHPLTFADLARLKILALSLNKIATIEPNAFKGLHSLQGLFLQNNELHNRTSFYKDMFQDLEALHTLDVKSNQGLVDSAISPSLRNLSSLWMDRYPDQGALGVEFRHLTNLQVLRLSGDTYPDYNYGSYQEFSWCILTTVPSNFFNNIQTDRDLQLSMNTCMIKEIGVDTFKPLSSLVALDISHNPWMFFGRSREKDRWTEGLNKNKITSLDLTYTWPLMYDHFYCDWSFESLAKSNLKTLILQLNQMKRLQIPMRNFPTTIEKLDMSYNCLLFKDLYISFVTSDLINFKLRELFVHSCKLLSHTSLKTNNAIGNTSASDRRYCNRHIGAGERVMRRESLQNVTLSPQNVSMGKTMNSLQSNITETLELTTVLHTNPYCPLDMKDLDSDITIICLPSNLEVFSASLSISRWEPYDPKAVPHIRILNNTVLRHVELADNLLTSWMGPIENVPSLKFLDLSRNQCTKISVHFFKYMASLQTLVLRGNKIGGSLVADVNGLTFSTLANLRTLDMSENNIKEISSRAFIYNTNLETLDLSSNKFSWFEPTFSTFNNISFLNLSGNLLPGLGERTCEELKLLKSRNKHFFVNLLDNRLSCTCDYLPFLEFILSNPDIFFGVDQMKFQYINRTSFYYKDLAGHFPVLARECLVQRFFILILIIFFVYVGTVGFCAVIYHKRWKLRYLYYIGRRRMHIGEHVGDYTPDADVFLTYDQDELQWRRFMQRIFLPGLNQRDITYILGETDFPGGDLMAHVTGAVVGTRKTVVLLSEEIFDDHHREFEMNLSIMREMDTRSLKIIPVFMEEVDLSLYPREIEVFLRNQWERCLTYSDTDEFWDSFVNAVREDD